MKTKIEAVLEEFCGSDYPLINGKAKRLSPKRNSTFPHCGLTVKEDWIEVDKDQLDDRLAKIAESKGITISLSSEDKRNRRLREGNLQVKIKKLSLKCKDMFLLTEKEANLFDLTDDQEELIQFIFNFFQDNSKWPTVREVVVADQLDGIDIESVVKVLPENKILIQDRNQENKGMYRLTLLGILHANASEKYWEAGNFFGNELKKAVKKQQQKTFNEIPEFEIINKSHGWSLFRTFGEAFHTTGYNHCHFDVEFSDYPKTVSQIKDFTDILSYLCNRYQIGQESTYNQIPEPILYTTNIPGVVIGTQQTSKNNEKEIQKFIDYETTDFFRKGHIEEINRAYSAGCYTSVFILCRKIIENMIIDILRKKFPPDTEDNTELYYDFKRKRFKDFKIILDNFYSKRDEFGIDRKIVERTVSYAHPLRKEANDKAHSWYHLVRKKEEIEKIDIQGIIDLIIKLEKNLDIQ